MVLEVDVPALAAARADGGFVVDVREAHEYVQGHVPGARLIPLRELGRRLHELPRSERIYLVCQSGARSQEAADLLRRAGVDAAAVAGGTSAWSADGHPVVRGPRADVSAA